MDEPKMIWKKISQIKDESVLIRPVSWEDLNQKFRDINLVA